MAVILRDLVFRMAVVGNIAWEMAVVFRGLVCRMTVVFEKKIRRIMVSVCGDLVC